MDIVQLGCGITGLVCAEHLARNPKVDHLVLADRNVDGAKALVSRLGNDKVSVKKASGTDPRERDRLLKSCDILVCSMPWRLNKPVLEAAARIGTNYVDFGLPLDAPGEEFFRLDRLCRDGGITALTAMGEEPGMSDVFAVYAAGRLDRADEAHVTDGDTGVIEGCEFCSLWSPVDLLDETSVPAAVFRDGRIEFLPPLHEREVYEFPEPLGTLPVYKTNHDETYFMPMFIKGLKKASFRIGIDDNFAKAAIMLRKMGMLSKDHIDVKGAKVRPIDVVVAVMPTPGQVSGKVNGHTGFVTEVRGLKGGKSVRMRVWTVMAHERAYELCRTNAGAYMVGTGGAVPTEMLIDGEITQKGLIVPEQLPCESFMRRLREKHVPVFEDIVEFG